MRPLVFVFVVATEELEEVDVDVKAEDNAEDGIAEGEEGGCRADVSACSATGSLLRRVICCDSKRNSRSDD